MAQTEIKIKIVFADESTLDAGTAARLETHRMMLAESLLSLGKQIMNEQKTPREA